MAHAARIKRGSTSVWIIEPDVVFTGSWQTLFEKYESDSSDLLAFQHNVSVLKQDGMESLAILHVLSRPSELVQKQSCLVARVSDLAKLCRRRGGAPLRFYQKQRTSRGIPTNFPHGEFRRILVP